MLFVPLPALAAPAGQQPGTVRHVWVVLWPEAGGKRVYFKKFRAAPGLIKRVRVLVGGEPVAGPPYLSMVGCGGTRHLAVAQKSWLWDGRNVYVALLLQPGRCAVAGKPARVTVVLTTVGT